MSNTHKKSKDTSSAKDNAQKVPSDSSIAEHKEFIQHCYSFRINLQRVKNHHDSRNSQQANHDAFASFKKMIEIANQEANGNGNLRHDFESWLLWNYDLNQEHASALIKEELGFGAKCVDEMMSGIRNKKDDNKKFFIKAFTEYEHAKRTLARRTVKQSHAQYVINYFSSILRKILAFDTTYMYGMYKDRLEGELTSIAQRIQALGFSQLAINVKSDWQNFETKIQVVNTSVILQKEEIDAALALCTLDDKRTFMQQMAKKIGEIYESIRDQLRQIRNNAFTLKQAFLNPILSPIESVKNIAHVLCHPLQTATVAWDWVKENPGKTAILVIGTVGISLAIGAVAGVVGTALYTGTSILSVTAADFVVGGIIGGSVLTTTALTAVGGKAARESALAASNAIDAEIMLRNRSLDQLNCEEEQYRKQAREAMRKQRQETEMERRGTSYELVDISASDTNTQHELCNLDNDSNRLANAAQEMQFAKEDVSRELVATYQEERTLNDHLNSIIQESKKIKEEIKRNQTDTIKTAAKQLISLLNEQDRFDDATKIFDALKRQDYDELFDLIDRFSVTTDPIDVYISESSANNNLEDVD